MNREFTLYSKRVVLPGQSEPIPATVVIQGEKIAAVKLSKDDQALDFGNLVIMPGLVDTHAHINEPGRTEWEGFETATRAASAGGITTVIDMPLNSIPATTTLSAFRTKMRAAEGRCSIDHGFWGGLVPGNLSELGPMADAGIMGFKAFLIESGVDEFPHVSEADLRAGMQVIAQKKLPLLVHAELERTPPSTAGNPNDYATYLASRPREWENEAIRMMIRLSHETGCRVHIVHLSSADALPDIVQARREGVQISVETCPHYLTLSSDQVPKGATHFKCAPPIREKENQDRLWASLRNGEIDLVVSDHSPCTPALKLIDRGDFMGAWGGIASLQFSLSVVWTEMTRNRGMGIADVVRLMCQGTAEFAGLGHRKGRIAPGLDADLVVWDPETSFTLEPSMIYHKHKLTPYEGKSLQGIVEMTLLRGQKVYERVEISLPSLGLGKTLFRERGDFYS